jgi:hypothetical protein
MEVGHEINVTNLDPEHLHALEDVMGVPLHRDQRLVIQVTESPRPAQSLTRISHQTGTFSNSVPLLARKQCRLSWHFSTACKQAVAHVGEKCGQNDWKKVYAGLTEEQSEAVDRDIKTRANITRQLP